MSLQAWRASDPRVSLRWTPSEDGGFDVFASDPMTEDDARWVASRVRGDSVCQAFPLETGASAWCVFADREDILRGLDPV